MSFIDIFISVVLALIMFGIGATLKIRDFRRTFVIPRGLLLGLVLQMIFLPLFAFFLAKFSGLSPEWQVGLFLIAICPGGSTSNFISYLVNADVALSISLTGVNTVIILFSIPLLSNLALDFFLGEDQTYKISVWSAFGQVLLVVFFPVLLGVLINHKFKELSLKLRKPLKYINIILLPVVFGVKFFASETAGGSGISAENIWQLLPITLVLHFGAIIFSYLLALKLLDKFLQATTIGIEVGLQNTALTLLVAGTIIGNNEMTKPALVYAIFSFFTTLLFAWISARNGRRLGKWFRTKTSN